MSITVYGLDGNAFDQSSIEAVGGRFLRSIMRLVFAGNYVAGGEVMDLTNAGGTAAAPNTVPPQARGLVSIRLFPISKLNTSLSATFGQYLPVIPAGAVVPLIAANNSLIKCKIYVGAGTEYVAGAYGADVLGDIVQAEAIWAR